MVERNGRRLSRRDFVRASAGAVALGGGGLAALGACDGGPTETSGGDDADGCAALRAPAALSLAAATLTAAPGTARLAASANAPAWLFNGESPGPTLRTRRGDRARIRLVNALGEPTIVHWHGLIVPEIADGHPRRAIDAGATFDYEFDVVQRAGTYWYHPHAHHRTGAQIQRGLAGFLIVRDEEEDALHLPGGDREILLLLQDRGGDASAFDYAATEADHLAGMLRGVPYGNGVRRPRLDVAGARYRFRVLNASHARIYRLGFGDARALTVIGNDGGLLPAPVEASEVWLGVGERVDLLVDFRDVPVGTRLALRSLPFTVPFGPTVAHPQGIAMELLQLTRVAGGTMSEPVLPAALSTVPRLTPADPAAVRTFTFRSSAHDRHLIDGRAFDMADMSRVDYRIALGRPERWRFFNDSAIPHPVHLHGTHFQVVSRTGGRETVYPYEGGWKDTVLVMPLETVEVLVRFDRYAGLFPLHCHNLQHEDMGMMVNVEVG